MKTKFFTRYASQTLFSHVVLRAFLSLVQEACKNFKDDPSQCFDKKLTNKDVGAATYND